MLKLSKGVLGLKFMRKTLEGLEKAETEKKHKKYFGTGDIKSESGTSISVPVPEAKVTVCPSYLQCERFNYARQSYGGMNSTVEENVRKGHWTVEYELPDPNEEDVKPCTKKIKLESKVSVKMEKEDRSEGEIDDENEDDDDPEGMSGPIVGSLIGTIGKRFNRKHDKLMKRPHEDPQDKLSEATVAPKRKKSSFWKNKKNKNRQNNSNNYPNKRQ